MADLEQLSTREGDLSELTLFRYLNDELEPAERKLVDDRLAASETDRARLDELRSFSAGVALAPPASLTEPKVEGNVVPGPWSQPAKIIAVVVALAAAVALLVLGTRLLDGEQRGGAQGPIARAETDSDGIRTKGSDFDLRVQVERERTQWLNDGDVVAPGETVQFVAYPRVEGYLLVVGVDATDSIYPCHPNKAGPAVSIEPVAGELVLEGGLTFDSVVGTEQIIGLFCPEAFSFDEVAQRGSDTLLDGWTPDEHCMRTDLRLVKESP